MVAYPPDLDLNILMQELNVSEKMISECGISKADLQILYKDYLHRLPELDKLKNQFVSEYIVSAKDVPFHSYSGRVKDPYHLIEKIIRKKSTNYEKYEALNISNYYKFVTDLIGCRIMLVYKGDWESVNSYLIGTFRDDPSYYIDSKKFATSYDTITKSMFMAERPVANIRLGDKEIYPKNLFAIEKDRYYRSLHYIVRYKEYYVEIQVRTIFEEAWSEIDHDVLYPYFKDHAMLVEYSRLINRAAGMCDEMGAFFKDMLAPKQTKRDEYPLDVPQTTTKGASEALTSKPVISADSQPPACPSSASSKELLNNIVYNK